MTTSDQGRSSGFFDSAYSETAPWDIGKAQPALIALIDEFAPSAPMLDVGCGTGDLALFLAERGLSVIGIDRSEIAVAEAKARASKAAPEVSQLADFLVGDALRLTLIPDEVRCVVDSGFFHLFGPLERQEFVRELATKLPLGGRYYLLGFAFQSPMPDAPREVGSDELLSLFPPELGWHILALRRAQFVTVRGDVPAIAACIERV